jgi:hypothetical protein
MSRVRDLPKATVLSAGDYILIDGPTGTRAIPADKVGGKGAVPNPAAAFNWANLIRPGATDQRNTIVRKENRGTLNSSVISSLNAHQYSNIFLGDYWELPNVGRIVVGGFNMAPGVDGDHVILVVVPYGTVRRSGGTASNEADEIGRLIKNTPTISSMTTKTSLIRRPGISNPMPSAYFPLTLAEVGYPHSIGIGETYIPLPGIMTHAPTGITTASRNGDKLLGISSARTITEDQNNPIITGIIVG